MLAAVLSVASLVEADQGQDIIGGTPSAENPAVGALLNPTHELFCTGTLIAPSCVLTAAHCVEGGFLDDGSFLIGPDLRLPYQELIGIGGTLVHPNYDPDQLTDDFAVVALLVPSSVAPIAMSAPPAANTQVRIIGYGQTEAATSGQKRIASVPVTQVNSTEIWIEGTPQTCFGDSGGPMLKAVGPGWEAVGVTSWGDQNCNTFGVFGRIDSAQGFIGQAMAEFCPATTTSNVLLIDGFESRWANRWSEAVTTGNSCAGICGEEIPGLCWCDDKCINFGDCCPNICQACGTGCITDGPEGEPFAPPASGR